MFKKFLIVIFIILIVLSGRYLGEIYIDNTLNNDNDNETSIGNIEEEENSPSINNTENNTSNEEIKEKENNLSINNAENNTSNEDIKEEIVEEEIFSEYYAKAEKLMQTMTIEEKVGQMFLARYPETGVISELLKSIGLNMNLAPVVDVPQNETSFIYKRSYGRGAEKTATYTGRLIETMNESNMISVMKHFPGYGDNVDTHTGIAIDNRPYQTFEDVDFLPFEKGIEAGAPCILVSHNIVKCIDEDKPASLSENTIKILREELKFSGIIMTDDLAMDAVKSYVENGEAAVQAVLAGNDMII